MGWTIRRGGTEIDVSEGDGTRETVLRFDGAEVDRRTADYWDKTTLTARDMSFVAQWGPRNTITTVRLLEGSDNGGAPRQIPLVPPPGSKAARREDFAREHPRLFVLHRVGATGLEIVLGVLGVGALVSAFFGQLMPRIDLSWIPSPQLPDIDPPSWLRYVDPFYWLGRLHVAWPDVDLPDWVDTVLGTSRYWFPLIVAAAIARHELDRRRTREEARADVDPDQPTDPGEVDPPPRSAE